MKKAIIHASELLTGAGVRRKDGRRVSEKDLGVIEDGALVYSYTNQGEREIPQKIEWVGPTGDLPRSHRDIPVLDLQKKNALIPGLVDCHTHPVFAGDRSQEFALRCGGASYEEIARKGGGILSTVHRTRDAGFDRLLELACSRVREMAALGIRTLEAKSGYGLSTEAEILSLRVIQKLKEEFPELHIHSTFLGAHAFPPEIPRETYLKNILSEMLPQIASEGLADSCDVFIDEGYFTLQEGRRILKKARSLGLNIRVHADELADTGATALAVELGALSADHLLKISKENTKKLAESDTVGVLLPGTAFYLKAPYAPARELLDAGAAIAIATDFNPGSCMCLHLPAVLTIAALYLGMTRAEIFSAVTYNAAKALGVEKTRGTLEPGQQAAFTILPFEKFEEIYYRFAWTPESGR